MRMMIVSLLLFHGKAHTCSRQDDARILSTYTDLLIFVLGIDSDHDKEIADSDKDKETLTRAKQHLSKPAFKGGPKIFIG